MYLLFILAFAVHIFGGLGITAGAHRLWSHRAYKAKTPLKILLMLQNCIAVQVHLQMNIYQKFHGFFSFAEYFI